LCIKEDEFKNQSLAAIALPVTLNFAGLTCAQASTYAAQVRPKIQA